MILISVITKNKARLLLNLNLDDPKNLPSLFDSDLIFIMELSGDRKFHQNRGEDTPTSIGGRGIAPFPPSVIKISLDIKQLSTPSCDLAG